jgi:hypothetical protein
MSNAIIRGKPCEASIEATITRADGRVEKLGTIAYWNRNPLRRWWFSLTRGRR